MGEPNITVKIGAVSRGWWSDHDGELIDIELKIVDSDVNAEDAIRWWEEGTKFRLVEVSDE